jgi:hypothetical protein
MQHIDSSSLSDLPSRIAYLSSFLELTAADGEALQAAKPLVAPLVPVVLDAVYTKLLSYDITAKAFVPRNTDYEGETAKDVQELTLDHPQIAWRKDFLAVRRLPQSLGTHADAPSQNYLVKLVSTSDLSPTSAFWAYLDKVGVMHTGKPGFKHREKKPELRVEFIHIGALLGYVLGVVIGATLEMDIDLKMKGLVIKALNKVLWIQNDLFARHYIAAGGE